MTIEKLNNTYFIHFNYKGYIGMRSSSGSMQTALTSAFSAMQQYDKDNAYNN